MTFNASRNIRYRIRLRTTLGTLITLNFILLWAVPFMVQGQLYRQGLHRVFRPVRRRLNSSDILRSVATRFVYRRAVHVDYFPATILFFVGFLLPLVGVFALQIATHSLPWYVIGAYYFVWVGPGGRTLAAAYTFAHREGHVPGKRMYRPHLGRWVGNLFENKIGIWFGIVPNIFSTSHVLLHHRMDGGKGDPHYLWDIDRTRLSDVMRYVWRFFLYTTGISGVAELRRQEEGGGLRAVARGRRKLIQGMATYWLFAPTAILTLLVTTGSSFSSSLVFLFFIYFQPFIAMTYFLTIINIGQHGFLEFNQEGRHVPHVTNVTILDGYDDSYGEDYHLLHHKSPGASHDRIVEHLQAEHQEWEYHHGSVFEKTTIFEVGIMTILGRFDTLARNHYVDYSNGSVSQDKLADLFRRRAQRTEMSYEEYEFQYRPRLQALAAELVRRGVCANYNSAYVYQAHCNLQSDLTLPTGSSE